MIPENSFYFEDHPLKHFPFSKVKKILFLTSEKLATLYFPPLEAFFKSGGVKVVPCVLEKADFERVSTCYELLAKNQFTETDGVFVLGETSFIALGSFLATTFSKKIPFYVMTTTLKSAVISLTKGNSFLAFGSEKYFLKGEVLPEAIYVDPLFLEGEVENQLKTDILPLLVQGSFNEEALFNQVATFLKNPAFFAALSQFFKENLNEFKPKELPFFETICCEEFPLVVLLSFTSVGEKRNLVEKGTTEKLRAILKTSLVDLDELLKKQETDFLDFLETSSIVEKTVTLPLITTIGKKTSYEVTTESLFLWF